MEAVASGCVESTAARPRPKTKIVCTLGPASRSVEMIANLLRAGMNVARFNFSHGSHAYHQETLDNLHAAMESTGILCAVMLDTKGPEIRTGFLKDGKPIHLQKGQQITITTDYSIKGDENLISMSYKKLAHDVKPGASFCVLMVRSRSRFFPVTRRRAWSVADVKTLPRLERGRMSISLGS
ncbi:hypothetical protein HPP92_007510 [Vanilla planifolia]|uniref:pyruvate kinase n=1 Tax=Vanilla planifolia TaxID=51239 RepID=A0A835RGT2_VANPL|nr:hypothetical protein HPP92_007510 [Vanilla planifolia]